MKPMFTSLALAASASAFVIERDTCCFKLTAQGGPGGIVGQLADGQNRIGDARGLPPGQYCISNGVLTDAQGRGCILTPPTTQWQCDVGAKGTPGFSISPTGILLYQGSPTFYSCPTGDMGAWNIYSQTLPKEPKCVTIQLMADNCFAPPPPTSKASSSSAKPSTSAQPSTSAKPSTSAQPSTSAKPSTSTQSSTSAKPSTSTQPSTSAPPSTSTKPSTSAPPPPPPSTSTVPTTSASSSTPPVCIVSTVTVPPGKSTSSSASSASAVCSFTTVTVPGKSTSVQCISTVTVTGPPKSSSSTMMTSKTSTKASSSSTMMTSSKASSSSSTPSKAPPRPTPTPAQACPMNLPRDFEFPHLMVPVDKTRPNYKLGNSYNGTANENISTIFNFDILPSAAGKTCEIVFLFPQLNQLETSSFFQYSKMRAPNQYTFTTLKAPGSKDSTFATLPAKDQNLGTYEMKPGNAYRIARRECPAGKTIGILMEGNYGPGQFTYFQDFNPCPIGLYIIPQ